jgi:radical SAM protein with 4Fe4S-binding SPASM domain
VIRFSPTIFHENYNKLELLYDFFVDLENKYGISFNPFASINCTEGKKLFALKKTGDFHNMLSEYAKLVLKEAEKEGNLLKLFTKIRMPTDFFRAIFRKQIGTTKCGAGIKAIVVYPDGSILGCKQLDSSVVRGKNLSWGNVFSSHFDDELRLLPLKDIITGGIPKWCQSCFIKNMCNGLCPGMAYNANEDFTNPDPSICETQKAYCKLSIWMFAKAQEKGLPLTNDLLEYRITYGGL